MGSRVLGFWVGMIVFAVLISECTFTCSMILSMRFSSGFIRSCRTVEIQDPQSEALGLLQYGLQDHVWSAALWLLPKLESP